MKKDIIAVIPVYKQNMSSQERMCFIQNSNILSKRKIILACPKNLDISEYQELCPTLQIKYFNFKYFEGIKGYNKLMLSQEFYTTFKDYTYVLICQIDVFLFRDDLDIWIAKGYDYIGAPWVHKPFFLAKYILAKAGFFPMFKAFVHRNLFASVGNGGLSLRKVSSFIESLSIDKRHTNYSRLNEDFYYSFFARTNKGKFLLPPYKEAIKFSIELSPQKMMKINKGILPMGIHAWERYDKHYWTPIINNITK